MRKSFPTKFGRVPQRNAAEFPNEIRRSFQRNSEEFLKGIRKSFPTKFGRVIQRNSAEFPWVYLLADGPPRELPTSPSKTNKLHLHQPSELTLYKTRLIRNGSKGNDSDISPCYPDSVKTGKNLISSLTQMKFCDLTTTGQRTRKYLQQTRNLKDWQSRTLVLPFG